MKIDHISIWVKDLETIKEFYIRHFEMTSNNKYINAEKKFSSYFLSFKTGTRIEIMHRPDILTTLNGNDKSCGLTHFAISVGSKEKVDKLTEILRNDGHVIAGAPRTTGDGCYESVVLDPEGNQIEITV